ncbi:NAD(P)/FAD-dependent oxidoreductase [Neptunomonas sp.]|uniref:flavin-dependent monooxygenase QhpG n=1 Tax=Neptunomonas sp. TaxID=1971898 RepID=UPI0035674D48
MATVEATFIAEATSIVILGAGPAGGAVALGLKKLGYTNIRIVGEARLFCAMEGVSERVVDGLRGAGFSYALEQLPPASARFVTWNGVTSQANTERLIDRAAFDAAILMDLGMQGIHVIQGRAGKLVTTATGHKVTVDSSGKNIQLDADFLVEARGRAAPAAKLKRLRGAETVSILQYWDGEPGERQSAVQSFEEGWAWMAADEKGRRYLQLTFDVVASKLPEKARLAEFCIEKLKTLQQAQPYLANAASTGEMHARTSTPILCQEAVGDNWIRVGDAAMAVDPLSGNGIFQALSSSLQAPAVINTLLREPEKALLAQRFHQLRVTELFFRFARIGRDFYAMEEQWADQAFWKTRAQWPDNQPMHQQPDIRKLLVKTLPVVNQGLIEAVDVVTSPDQPLGVWHLNGVPLAPIVLAYQSSPDEFAVIQEQCIAMQLNELQQRQVLQWLMAQGASF